MATIHFLNVRNGDCSIIQNNSGRTTVIDICNGNAANQRKVAEAIRNILGIETFGAPARRGGNFGMRDKPTDPVEYIRALGVGQVFRFILSHPDMDHMDGFKALCDDIGIVNFWDSGVRKEKPDFSGGPYNEGDWDHYVKVRDGRTDVKVVTPRAGSHFQFANAGEPNDGGDYLSIVAPSNNLVDEANADGDVNDGSYVIVYRSAGGRIVFPGDAHDATWEYVLANHHDLVADCAVLIAPHHGRASDRSYDFLDVLRPGLTLFGCADSEHLAYDAWSSRDLPIITNNQAGNIVLEPSGDGVDVFVENLECARTYESADLTRRSHGCYFVGRVAKPQPVA
ncbi:MAG: hypothetical protein CHACPFDD_00873 [Phycisphaerae bacterium]|nr:hypothetical protein [Phycisphaerae bacterium]